MNRVGRAGPSLGAASEMFPPDPAPLLLSPAAATIPKRVAAGVADHVAEAAVRKPCEIKGVVLRLRVDGRVRQLIQRLLAPIDRSDSLAPRSAATALAPKKGCGARSLKM